MCSVCMFVYVCVVDTLKSESRPTGEENMSIKRMDERCWRQRSLSLACLQHTYIFLWPLSSKWRSLIEALWCFSSQFNILQFISLPGAARQSPSYRSALQHCFCWFVCFSLRLIIFVIMAAYRYLSARETSPITVLFTIRSCSNDFLHLAVVLSVCFCFLLVWFVVDSGWDLDPREDHILRLCMSACMRVALWKWNLHFLKISLLRSNYSYVSWKLNGCIQCLICTLWNPRTRTSNYIY